MAILCCSFFCCNPLYLNWNRGKSCDGIATHTASVLTSSRLRTWLALASCASRHHGSSEQLLVRRQQPHRC